MRALVFLVVVLVGMAAPAEEDKEVSRTWKVPADFAEVLARELAEQYLEKHPEVAEDDPFETGPKFVDGVCRPGPDDLSGVLGYAAIWLSREQIEFSPWTGELTLTGPRGQLERFDEVYRKLGPLPQFVIDPEVLQRENDPEAKVRGQKAEVYMKKLKTIVLPSVNFAEDTTLGEAVKFLEKESRLRDKSTKKPKERGVNLTVVDHRELEQVRVGALSLKHIPLHVALQYVVEKKRIRFRVSSEGVQILPLGWREPNPPRYKARWVVDPEIIDRTFGKKVKSGKVPLGALVERLELEAWQFGKETSAAYDREARVFEMVNEEGVLHGVHAEFEKVAVAVTRERLPKKTRK